MTFQELRQKAGGMAKARCHPRMSVAELDEALRGAARDLMRDAGGAAALFSEFPELLLMTVDTRRFGGATASIGDILDEVGVGSLLAVMQPVWFTTLTDSFNEGFVAAVEHAVAFVVSAHQHAGGLIDENIEFRLKGFLTDISDGYLSEAALADAMETSERMLRHLSGLHAESRIAAALGGIDEIRARHQVAVKLNLVRAADPSDFLKWFGEEIAERTVSAPSAR